MAARLTKRQADNAKAAIQTSLLLKKLQEHVLEGHELKNSQVRSAEILLKKTLPDLAKTEVTGNDDGPIQVGYSILGLARAKG